MVKGISRRVILVDNPDSGAFEQAIFILPKDGSSVSQQQLVDEAIRVAKSYARTHGAEHRVTVRPAIWAAIGGGVIGAAWLLVTLL